jgi:thiol-disulfide isomerase/thioredoxin
MTWSPMLVALLFGASLWGPAGAAPGEGHAAPAFEVRTLDGQVINSANAKGKVVVLHFWATWCQPCREEMPALDAFYREHRQDGLEIVSVSIEEASDLARVKAFIKAFSFPVAVMTAARVQDYGQISFLPLTFVIDRQGIMRKSAWVGSERINAASLDRYVQPLLREP